MGTLVAMVYPTKLFANLADHTYVKCGTGKKAWSCWGGKEGGEELRRGNGSTNRANTIAAPDEKAGIKCYLVNGVCHQAANRILMPAGITVRGARGYSISEALFGTYGRVGIWPCSSPFNQYPNVTGDLPECIDPLSEKGAMPSLRVLSAPDKLDWQYINGVLKIYGEALPMLKSKSVAPGEATELHLKLFMYMAEFNLGPMLDKKLATRLKRVRQEIEKARLKIEQPLSVREVKGGNFVEQFNKITIDFQDKMANSMTAEQYITLFDLKPDERVILADPSIVDSTTGMK
jgi:hypothetical protein